jgi:hypothetical protein
LGFSKPACPNGGTGLQPKVGARRLPWVSREDQANANGVAAALTKIDDQYERGSPPYRGTTTYPDIFPEDAAKFKRDMQVLIGRMKRRFPGCGILWRLEFKRRKSRLNLGKVAQRYHWLLWGVPRKFDFKRERGQ